MEKMTRNEFYEFAAQEIINRITGAENVKTELTDIVKLGESYKGLVIRKDNDSCSPVLNLDKAYVSYTTHGDAVKAVSELAEQANSAAGISLSGTDFGDYEIVKGKLFIRVSNMEAVKDRLDGVPHKEVCDLVMTCHIDVGTLDGANANALVTNALLERYGVTAEQLIQDAISNSVETKPVKVQTLFGILTELSGVEPERDENSENIYVVTNKYGAYGAAALFYPETMARVGKLLGGDYFILPSSIHEMLVLKDDGNQNTEQLAEMVYSVNREQVAPAERLSDHVYHYSCETGTFEIVA